MALTKENRACEGCRAKKVKCDGLNPCRNCKKRNLDCSYGIIKKRGRKKTREYDNMSSILLLKSKTPLEVNPFTSFPHCLVQDAQSNFVPPSLVRFQLDNYGLMVDVWNAVMRESLPEGFEASVPLMLDYFRYSVLFATVCLLRMEEDKSILFDHVNIRVLLKLKDCPLLQKERWEFGRLVIYLRMEGLRVCGGIREDVRRVIDKYNLLEVSSIMTTIEGVKTSEYGIHALGTIVEESNPVHLRRMFDLEPFIPIENKIMVLYEQIEEWGYYYLKEHSLTPLKPSAYEKAISHFKDLLGRAKGSKLLSPEWLWRYSLMVEGKSAIFYYCMKRMDKAFECFSNLLNMMQSGYPGMYVLVHLHHIVEICREVGNIDLLREFTKEKLKFEKKGYRVYPHGWSSSLVKKAPSPPSILPPPAVPIHIKTEPPRGDVPKVHHQQYSQPSKFTQVVTQTNIFETGTIRLTETYSVKQELPALPPHYIIKDPIIPEQQMPSKHYQYSRPHPPAHHEHQHHSQHPAEYPSPPAAHYNDYTEKESLPFRPPRQPYVPQQPYVPHQHQNLQHQPPKVHRPPPYQQRQLQQQIPQRKHQHQQIYRYDEQQYVHQEQATKCAISQPSYRPPIKEDPHQSPPCTNTETRIPLEYFPQRQHVQPYMEELRPAVYPQPVYYVQLPPQRAPQRPLVHQTIHQIPPDHIPAPFPRKRPTPQGPYPPQYEQPTFISFHSPPAEYQRPHVQTQPQYTKPIPPNHQPPPSAQGNNNRFKENDSSISYSQEVDREESYQETCSAESQGDLQDEETNSDYVYGGQYFPYPEQEEEEEEDYPPCALPSAFNDMESAYNYPHLNPVINQQEQHNTTQPNRNNTRQY